MQPVMRYIETEELLLFLEAVPDSIGCNFSVEIESDSPHKFNEILCMEDIAKMTADRIRSLQTQVKLLRKRLETAESIVGSYMVSDMMQEGCTCDE
jgi:hypothetical protein